MPRLRLPVPTPTRWQRRSAWMLLKSQVPRPLRPQKVHLGFYNALNFGDLLSPLVTQYVLGAPVVEGHWAGADLTAVGSVLGALERYPNRHRPYVWGSGFIDAGPKWRGGDIRPVAVRGQLSRDRVEHLADGEVALGDPGLLVARMFPALREVPKRYSVGLIPHISERNHPVVRDILSENPEAHFINAGADPRLVLEQIAASEFIVSSSLHGLVCADALGIPNQWTPISSAVDGAGYKFEDYYSAFDVAPQPVGMKEAVQDRGSSIETWRPFEQMDAMIDRLIEVFPSEDLFSRYRR